MAQDKLHVVVVQLAETRPISLGDVLGHARAVYHRDRSRTIFSVVFLQFVGATLTTLCGLPPRAVLLGALGTGLFLAMLTGLIAWSLRKEVIR